MPTPALMPTAAGIVGDDDDAAALSRISFESGNMALITMLLGMSLLANYLIKTRKVYWLPESAAAIFVGIVAGIVAVWGGANPDECEFLGCVRSPTTSYSCYLLTQTYTHRFNPDLFTLVLLPPIIFEAGYSLDRKSFFKNAFSISLFAIAGTIISTFVVGCVPLSGKTRPPSLLLTAPSPTQVLVRGGVPERLVRRRSAQLRRPAPLRRPHLRRRPGGDPVDHGPPGARGGPLPLLARVRRERRQRRRFHRPV